MKHRPPAGLMLVAVPIGNLGDISQRAIDTLRAATVIACEDTRRTTSLLRHLGIERPRMVVLNDHTERATVDHVVAAVESGDRVVVVSDAGMPAISDPGWRVVRAAVDAGVDFEVVPGASALLVALVASGLPTDRFVFDGFLPRKGSERSIRLAEIAAQPRTTVLYEAPHRLERTLSDLAETCGGDRQVAVARELTKLYEQVWRGSLTDAVAWAHNDSPRGEIVIVLDGAPPEEITDESLAASVDRLMGEGSSLRDAVDEVTRTTGAAKRRVYNLALQLGR